MLCEIPGERARRITYAVSLTNSVTPDAVDRIVQALITKVEDEPIRAFESQPIDRIGAILNSSRSVTCDDMLIGLDEEDQEFATKVRKAIFTFKHIANRVDARNFSSLLKSVDNDTLVTALASATHELTKQSADFILANISGRMADQLREAIEERGTVGEEDGKIVMAEVVAGLRDLAQSAEILIIESVEPQSMLSAERSP